MKYRVLRPLTRRLPAREHEKRPRTETLDTGQVVELDADEAERLNGKSPQPALEPVAGLKAERVQLTEEKPAAKKPAARKTTAKKATPKEAGGSAPAKADGAG
jgi:hypothetical protein